ncbi:MAG: hypothetical protein ACYS0G_13605 [Planctomycetota bacterium]|jgi:hypothetical protein
MARPTFNAKYDNHWALVVGINAYKHATPLGYACNDASAFADQLTTRFAFPHDKVAILLVAEKLLELVRLHCEFLVFADLMQGNHIVDDRIGFAALNVAIEHVEDAAVQRTGRRR